MAAQFPNALVGITGRIRAETQNASELEDAVGDLERALISGQELQSALPVFHREMLRVRAEEQLGASRDFLGIAVESAKPVPITEQRAAAPMVTLRNAPFAAAIDPLAPEWARNAAPSITRGPFVTNAGERFWIDTFTRVSRWTLVIARAFGAPRPLIYFPTRAAATIRGRTITLTAGSVWFPAAFFVTGRSPDEFVGVRIAGGTLLLDGPVNRVDHTLTVTGNTWRARLKLELAPAAAARLDDVELELPRQLTFEFDGRGISSLQLADFDAAAFGNRIELRRSDAPAFYDEVSRSIVLPCVTNAEIFSFRGPSFGVLALSGSASVQRAGWSMPVTKTAANKLTEAASAGAVWLQLGSGIHAKPIISEMEWTAPKTTLQLTPDTAILYIATTTEQLRATLGLWQENVTPTRRSSIEFSSDPGSVCIFIAQAGMKASYITGKATAHLDRPVAADGKRLAAVMSRASFAIIETSTETQAFVLAIDDHAGEKQHLAFALENLLLKVRPPAWFFVWGKLAGSGIEDGRLILTFARRFGLPTLPDPYAANFETRSFSDVDSGWISSATRWPEPSQPTLSFSMQMPQSAEQESGHGLSREGPTFYLLDLSTRIDQFGVAVPLFNFSRAKIEDLALVTETRAIALFTLPPISWEPMLTANVPPGSTDPPLAPPPHDGGAALLQADSVHLVPIAPRPLFVATRNAIGEGRHFAAKLPLPFGIIAHINTRTADEPVADFIARGGELSSRRPVFPTLRGGLQLSFRAPKSSVAGVDPVLPGLTETVNQNNYIESVLSQNIHTRWAGDFNTGNLGGIPVTRYDWSGYGASMFSDWRNRIAVGPAIIQARFDVLVGRTAYEVVQMQSFLYPWAVRVVRTITIERKPGGWILREDSGWVAASNGLFDFPHDEVHGIAPAFPPQRIHKGAVRGVVNVRNIRLQGADFPVPPPPAATPVVWQPVIFDADVLIGNNLTVTAGGVVAADGVHVASRNITGYIQIDGPPYNVVGSDGKTISLVAPASAANIYELLLRKGAASAPVACAVEGGPAGKQTLELRTARADVSCNDNAAQPHLVAALRGTPVLPRDGAWSLARKKDTDTAPNALDPQFAVPLVRPESSAAGADRWHLADPLDITRLGQNDIPTIVYGFLQATGTQKLFFPRPQVTDTDASIKLPRVPKLADVASLFNAEGIFPNLGDAFDLGTLQDLPVKNGELAFTQKFPIAKVGSQPRKSVLMDLGGTTGLRVLIRYAGENDAETQATVKLDPGANPRWEITLERVCFQVEFKGKALISIYSKMHAAENRAPGVAELNIRYESFLSALQTVFSNIQEIARFLPGGAGAGLKVGFQNGALTVRNAFSLPNLPLGSGEITDVALNMGFALQLTPVSLSFRAGIGSSEEPFRWVVSPLSGTGAVEVGVSNKGLDVLVQAGLGLGLAIDLGIAAGSASIALAFELNTEPDPFQLKVILSGRASVDVLRGLASATITLAAGIGIIPPANFPPPLPPFPPQLPVTLGPYTIGFVASVAVGIHISVCWVVDVDWDDYWQFRQDITTPSVNVPPF